VIAPGYHKGKRRSDYRYGCERSPFVDADRVAAPSVATEPSPKLTLEDDLRISENMEHPQERAVVGLVPDQPFDDSIQVGERPVEGTQRLVINSFSLCEKQDAREDQI
jgi:hypothetical protein